METLKSEQARLCEWLSEDPEFILDQCGDILSMNDYKTVQKQTSASEKTGKLLEILVNRGEEPCLSFIEILKQHQAHYKPLQQFFSPNKDGSFSSKVFADKSCLVSVNEVSNTAGKSYSNTVTIFTGGSGSSDTKARELPKAEHIATDNSAIFADKISGSSFENITFSTFIKPSQPDPGQVDSTQDVPLGPVGKMINSNRVELIDCLRGDPHILQHVHGREIITGSQYQTLTKVLSPVKAATVLIDLVLGRGEEICQQFIEVLKIPDVLETYPQLKRILKI